MVKVILVPEIKIVAKYPDAKPKRAKYNRQPITIA